MQPSLIRDRDEDPLSKWQDRNGVCEMERIAGHWSGRQERTSVMFGGVPEDPRETLLTRLDAALAEAQDGPAEGKGKRA